MNWDSGGPMITYWLKIALGAALVFVVGLTIYRLVESSVNRVRQVATTAEPITVPLVVVPFRIDSVELGTISSVRLLRSTPRHVRAAQLSVSLGDSVDSDRFANCLIAARDIRHLDHANSMSCIAAADTAGLGLVSFGTVIFDDGELTRPLLVPQSQIDEINRDLARNGSAEPAIPGVPSRDSLDSAIRVQVQEQLRGVDSIRSRANFIRDSVAAAIPDRKP